MAEHSQKGQGDRPEAFKAPMPELLAPLEKEVGRRRAAIAALEAAIVAAEDTIFAARLGITKERNAYADLKAKALHAQDPSDRIPPEQLKAAQETSAKRIAAFRDTVAKTRRPLADARAAYKAALKDGARYIRENFRSAYAEPVAASLGKPGNAEEVLVYRDTMSRVAMQKFALLELLSGSRLPAVLRRERGLVAACNRWKAKAIRHKAALAKADSLKPLTKETKAGLLFPVYEPVKAIQAQIDALRVDGEDKVVALRNEIRKIRDNHDLDRKTKVTLLRADKAQLRQANLIARRNRTKVSTLIQKAELFLYQYYNPEYHTILAEDVKNAKAVEKSNYKAKVAQARAERAADRRQLAALPEQTYEEKRDKKVKTASHRLAFKNRFDELRLLHTKALQGLKDEKHASFIYKYHLIDLLRNSRFTPAQNTAQRAENYAYGFKLSSFLLKYGLYLTMFVLFVFICIWAPVSGKGDLFTVANILRLLEQSSPRIVLALGVAGLILLGGTDLSVGRMVALASVITGMLFYPGTNIISLFGQPPLDFTSWPNSVRILVALLLSIGLCAFFSALAGFFSAKFKMHPFITTLSTQLIIYGLIYYSTNGLATGGEDNTIKNMLVPWLGGVFPSVILWAVGATIVIWIIWNKTKFGKYMYAVGGNAEAASVSGISVFWVTLGVFIMAGVLYGLGGFLELNRLGGGGSALSGNGYELDAIAACVVGGISFNGGIGKISGAVAGVIIFQALTYALSFMGIDTNLQFILKGIIILVAVTLDSIKYIRKK